MVVTIVVLLILAGITITFVLGENSIFSKAIDAKLKTDIATWKEKLELARNPIFIEGLGTFNPNKYFEYIEQQAMINNKNTDVIDNGDGTYEVTTKPGYVFEIELIPNKENPVDAQIEYIGQVGKLPPKVKSIKVIGKTGTSIEIQVEVVRLEGGKLSYYYKEVEEPESAYKEVKKDVTDVTATIGNLNDGKIYHIKVVAKNEKGENKLVVIEAIQQLVKTITLDKTTAIMKPSDTLQLTANVLPENAENKILEWSSSDESIATVSDTGLVTAKTIGNISITAKSTDGSEVTASCNIIVKIPVENISLNKTSTQVEPKKTTTLVATINPSNATNKEVTWTSSNTSIATVSSTGVVTGKELGTVTITVKSVDDATKSKSCIVKVTDETDWEEMNEIAKKIANTSSITNSSTQATVTVNGESKTVKVGDIYKVKYNGEIRQVRVLGFKHDDLVNIGVYGGSHQKASISFDFLDFMTGENHMQMSTRNTNAGGWANTKMRTDLNGSGGSIGGLGVNLSNKAYIKQVKKKYITTYNVASTSTCNDFLWLLASSEIHAVGGGGGEFAHAITSEGSRYQYFVEKNPNPNYSAGCLVKKAAGQNINGVQWWLRSPLCYSANGFGKIAVNGGGYYGLESSGKLGVAPGFCI